MMPIVLRKKCKLYDDALSAAKMAQAHEELYADTIRCGRVQGPLNIGAVHVRF
jgi:hypothetical protein